MKEEIWKDIKNYEGLYQVSNKGRVRSLDRLIPNNGSFYKMEGVVLKQFRKQHGYLGVRLCKGIKNQKCYFVHKLVAETYIPNPNNLPEINHKDGNKQNNNVENLEYCTHSENVRHAYNTGLRKKYIGKNSPSSKAVVQYDMQGNFIKYWDCINDVKRELKIHDISISRCCRGLQKHAGGYVWKYDKEDK